MKKVALSLGSNVGDKYKHIIDAIKMLKESLGSDEITVASYYLAEPYGVKDQEWFLNTALIGKTDLSPQELLVIVKEIENKIGRIQRRHWGEREIDIDIIFYQDETVFDEQLTIPHPETEKRRFVLLPLAEIALEFTHPVYKKTVSELLQECEDTSIVNLYSDILK